MARNEDPYHLGQLVLDNLAENPKEICQIDATTDVSETRWSLRERGIKFAKHMTKLGLKVNDIVTVSATNHNDSCLPLMAGFMTGVAVNSLDILMSKLENKHMVKLTQPKMIFCEPQKAEEFYEIMKELGLNVKIVVFGDAIDDRFTSVKEFYENDYSTENYTVANFDTTKVFAYIICSSGSTGMPKGVCHTHKSIKIRIDGMSPFFENDKIIQFGSNYWVSCLLATVFNVTIKCVKINSRGFTPSLFFNYIEKYKFEATCVTPAVLKMIVKHPDFAKADISSMKKFMLGGATVDLEDIKTLQKRIPNAFIFNGYGISEVGGAFTYVPKDLNYIQTTVGKMHPWVQAKIVDMETGKLITEPNKPGEMYVKGDVMMAGYLNNPEATAEVLDADGWFATGDVCTIDEDGVVCVIDRLKDMFKYFGFAIAPATIEQVINNVPGVAVCGVIGVDNKESGHVPMAFVKRFPGSSVTAEQIKQAVKDNLAHYCELRGGVVFVEALAMTASIKLKRGELKKLINVSKIE